MNEFQNQLSAALPQASSPARSADYEATLTSSALFDVSARGKLRVSGKDAATWLHNLCTNDVKNLPSGAFCEAFFTTPKARVLAHVLIYHAPPEPWGPYLLDMVPGLTEKLRQHLGFYIISEDVELAHLGNSVAHLRVLGPDTGKLLATTLGAEPALAADNRHRVLTWNGHPVALSPAYGFQVQGADLFCTSQQVATLAQLLIENGAIPGSTSTLETLRLEAGFPEFGPDIDDGRLVMEVGRTEQAICYTKGCFLGQEPIVMARDRGQVNRTLMGVTAAGEPLVPGSKLLQGGAEVGQVTSAVFSPRLGKHIGLAYLRRGFQAPGLKLVAVPPSSGRPVFVAALPFV